MRIFSPLWPTICLTGPVIRPRGRCSDIYCSSLSSVSLRSLLRYVSSFLPLCIGGGAGSPFSHIPLALFSLWSRFYRCRLPASPTYPRRHPRIIARVCTVIRLYRIILVNFPPRCIRVFARSLLLSFSLLIRNTKELSVLHVYVCVLHSSFCTCFMQWE